MTGLPGGPKISGRPLSPGSLNFAANDGSDPTPTEMPTAIPTAASALSNLLGLFISGLLIVGRYVTRCISTRSLARSLLIHAIDDRHAAGISNIFEVGRWPSRNVRRCCLSLIRSDG